MYNRDLAAWMARTRREHRRQESRMEEHETVKEVDHSRFAETPSGFKRRARVTLQTVANAAQAAGQKWTQAIIEVNQDTGVSEYQVAALLIWVACASNKMQEMLATRAALYPMAKWEEDGIMEISEITRKAAQQENSRISDHTLFARMKTLLGRDMRQADFEEEVKNRSGIINARKLPEGNYQEWKRALRKAIHEVAKNAFLGMGPENDETISEMWEKRSLWAPSGTSSVDKNRRVEIGKYSERSRGLRWSKCTAWSVCRDIDETKISEKQDKVPEMVARPATKNEPGLKRRVLRACDDYTFLRQAHASGHIEKNFKAMGAVMRQTPDDVKEVGEKIRSAKMFKGGKKLIMCLDYSAFNENHNVSDRWLLNMILAGRMEECGLKERAKSARWVARAHLNHYIDGRRVNSGLSSGERDTARDNTLLHCCYSRIAMRIANARLNATGDEQSTMSEEEWDTKFRCCGDDEIVVGVTREFCREYMRAVKEMGFRLQVKKTMLSETTGEFLQYEYRKDGRLPEQPPAPNAINLVSGSWYKAAGYNEEDLPMQMEQAIASIVRRGCRVEMAQELMPRAAARLIKGNWREAIGRSFLSKRDGEVGYVGEKRKFLEGDRTITIGARAAAESVCRRVTDRREEVADETRKLAMERAFAGADFDENKEELEAVTEGPEFEPRLTQTEWDKAVRENSMGS
jgi:hypothetical protein